MNLKVDVLESMPPVDEVRFFEKLESLMADDDGNAVQKHLAAGYPVLYCDPRFPNTDEMVREWPDGRKELVLVNQRQVTVLRPL